MVSVDVLPIKRPGKFLPPCHTDTHHLYRTLCRSCREMRSPRHQPLVPLSYPSASLHRRQAVEQKTGNISMARCPITLLNSVKTKTTLDTGFMKPDPERTDVHSIIHQYSSNIHHFLFIIKLFMQMWIHLFTYGPYVLPTTAKHEN